MKRVLALFFYIFTIPLSVFSATCPSFSCPADSQTPVVHYAFENNLSDSSGHALHAGPIDGSICEPAFASGIGGRPGTYLKGSPYAAYCGVSFPACAFWSDEGEMEWYQYVTITPAGFVNTPVWWCTNGCDGGLFAIRTGGLSGQPQSVDIAYTTLVGAGPTMTQVQYGCDCLIYNVWQHFSFQWGSFGTRLLIDGIQRTGSSEKWAQEPRDYADGFLGMGWNDDAQLFMGYIDDFKIWACSFHGTMTVTPTLTCTKTPTYTPTRTITETWTASPTDTITVTFEPTSTFTISETHTISPTFTKSPVPTLTLTFTTTFTATLTHTITPTITFTATPSEIRLVNIFPNPAKDSIKVVFSSDTSREAVFSFYGISGEKTGTVITQAYAGLNSITVRLKNYDGIAIASGTYLYRLELKNNDKKAQVIWGKFSVAR